MKTILAALGVNQKPFCKGYLLCKKNMYTHMKYLIAIGLFLVCFQSFPQNQALFDKANTLYNEGKYAEAIDAYAAILETNNHSSDLYFNIANAHYKLNHIAPSIYFYEKALQLAPHDADIINNSAYAKNMTIDAIDFIPETGFARLIKKTITAYSFEVWAKVAIALVFCFVGFFLLYYFAFGTLKKRISFIASLIALLLVCITLVFAFFKYDIDKNNNPAIVFAQETVVRSDPNNRSEAAFILHEGTKVLVLESYKNWQKIKLSDGKMGWIISEDIKLINDI